MTDAETIHDRPAGAADTVALVGLGNMGLPMARRIVASGGHRLRGFDVAPGARSAAASAGIEVVDQLGDAAAPVVILMLPSSQVVEEVVVEAGLESMLPEGAVLIDMSSSEPLRTQRLAARLAERAITLVDAPVSGGVKGAREGTLTIMAGGADDALDAVTPLLETMGRVRRTGPVGSGHALKALNNLMSATHLLVSCEAIEAGRRFGLDAQTMLDVVNTSSGRSFSTEYKWPSFILPETFDAGFGLRLLVKDARIAVSLARELGLPARLGEAALSLWEQAAEELPADADHTSIDRFVLGPVPAND